MQKQRVAIIGGGITGLSAAYYLSKSSKYQVHLFENQKKLGGLLGVLTINGIGFEGYYHHLAKSDTSAINLIKELGLENKILYLPSKVGIFYKDNIYSFSSPLDLLKFSQVSLISRLRLGLAALYLQKFITKRNWKKLRKISAEKWLKKWVGSEGCNIIWKPLLRGKFGPYANKVSMAWLWHRIHWRGNSRNKSGTKEELVYLKGGFKVLIDKLVEEIKNNGGKIYTNTQVKKISPANNQQIRLSLKDIFKGSALKNSLVFNKCIATVPNPIFIKMTPDLSKQMKKRLLKVKYRGAMVVVFQLKKQFMQGIYWLNVHETNMRLLAVVEHTNFVSPQNYGGKHLLYAGNYPAQDDPIMTMDKQKLVNLLTRELKLINPEFDKTWVEKYWIFRDKYAQPIITTDYYKYIPPVEVGISNLYFVNMAQVYPEDRGINQAIRDGKRIADKISDSIL